MSAKHILVVENDASTRKLLEVLLRHTGHDVTSVGGGEAALDLIAKNSYDLAIVDLMMPAVSGQQVIAYIEEHAPSMPVLVCTAAGPSVTDLLSSSAIRAVIRKPFNILDITEAVDAHARTRPPMTVLIVDDDESTRYVLRTMVDPANVVEAQDAEAALQAVARQRPDAVLLDLMLPGIPGEELLRRLKGHPDTAEIPVVVVTSHKLAPDEPLPPALALAAGYIFKGDLSREMMTTVLQVVIKTKR
ncbi:MAG TPA: response regulator [Thermoanaerobaculia bacterium]|nr:response regulator [Thermoanaerobaculia bacterium]